jgi:hypothetical protein
MPPLNLENEEKMLRGLRCGGVALHLDLFKMILCAYLKFIPKRADTYWLAITFFHPEFLSL